MYDQYTQNRNGIPRYSRWKNDATVSSPEQFDIELMPNVSQVNVIKESREFDRSLLSGELDAAIDLAASLLKTVVRSTHRPTF